MTEIVMIFNYFQIYQPFQPFPAICEGTTYHWHHSSFVSLLHNAQHLLLNVSISPLPPINFITFFLELMNQRKWSVNIPERFILCWFKFRITKTSDWYERKDKFLYHKNITAAETPSATNQAHESMLYNRFKS